MSSLHIFNHIKQKIDTRDLNYSKIQKVKSTSLPSKVDLRTTKYVPEIIDQGQLGSCTANATSNALRFLLKKEKLVDWQPSRLYIYWFSRFLEGTTDSDSGCVIRDVMKSIHTYGACDEKLLPYNINKFKQRPNNNCVRQATPHTKDFKYFTVNNDTNSIKSCLAEGYPVVFGFDVYSSFESKEVAESGVVPMPNTENEELLGGHCVSIYGYDDSNKTYIVMNSWGSLWGDKGFCYMPYDYLSKLGSDLWSIRFFD